MTISEVKPEGKPDVRIVLTETEATELRAMLGATVLSATLNSHTVGYRIWDWLRIKGYGV